MQKRFEAMHPREDQKRKVRISGLSSAFFGLLMSLLAIGFAGSGLTIKWLQAGLVGSTICIAMVIVVFVLSSRISRAYVLELIQAITVAITAIVIWLLGWVAVSDAGSTNSGLIVTFALSSLVIVSVWNYRDTRHRLTRFQEQLIRVGKFDSENGSWDLVVPLDFSTSSDKVQRSGIRWMSIARWIVALTPLLAQALVKLDQQTMVTGIVSFIVANIFVLAAASKLAVAAFLINCEKQLGRPIPVSMESASVDRSSR